jgi:hypothetical protein
MQAYLDSLDSRKARFDLVTGPSFYRGRLFDHQKEFLGFALARWGLCDRLQCRGGGVISSHMGSGKTVMAMCLAFAAAKEGRSSVAIVPTAVKSAWMGEAMRCLGDLAEVVDAREGASSPGRPAFVVGTHNDLYGLPGELETRFPASMVRDDVQHVFVDEAHVVPKVFTKTSVVQLSRMIESNRREGTSLCVWPITGTPFSSDESRNARSIRSLCSMVTGKVRAVQRKEDVPMLFKAMFFVPSLPSSMYPAVVRRDVVSPGFAYPEELRVDAMLGSMSNIAGITLRRKLAQTMGTFMGKVRNPGVEEIVKKCGVELVYMGAVWGYHDCLDFSNKKRDWSSLFEAAAAAQPVGVVLGTGGTKMDMIRLRLAEDRAQNGGVQPKTLVFAEHRMAIDQYSNMINSLEGVSCAAYHGDVSSDDRTDIIDRYRGSKLDVIVMQIQAGGCGINLGNTRHVYLTTPSWDPCVEDQAVARAVRADCEPGHVVCVTRFLIVESIEEDVLRVSNRKRAKTEELNRVVLTRPTEGDNTRTADRHLTSMGTNWVHRDFRESETRYEAARAERCKVAPRGP